MLYSSRLHSKILDRYLFYTFSDIFDVVSSGEHKVCFKSQLTRKCRNTYKKYFKSLLFEINRRGFYALYSVFSIKHFTHSVTA